MSNWLINWSIDRSLFSRSSPLSESHVVHFGLTESSYCGYVTFIIFIIYLSVFYVSIKLLQCFCCGNKPFSVVPCLREIFHFVKIWDLQHHTQMYTCTYMQTHTHTHTHTHTTHTHTHTHTHNTTHTHRQHGQLFGLVVLFVMETLVLLTYHWFVTLSRRGKQWRFFQRKQPGKCRLGICTPRSAFSSPIFDRLGSLQP